MTESTHEKEIHELFDITLILKGAHAIIEIIGGILIYSINIENFRIVQRLGGGSKSFAVFYLISHGVINGLVVLGLWKEKIWAYPLSMGVIGAFIVYQLYLLSGHYSIWLVLFTILDIFIIFLVWHEYHVLKKNKAVS